jgi:predicted enzyme related to lactoylglutathione lyase
MPPREAVTQTKPKETHVSQDPEVSRARSLVHGQLCYLQLPAIDSTRAAAFYQAVFGWEIEEHYPDFEAPGLIGQWVQGRPPARDAGPMIWLHVADIKETLNRVTEHGGAILEPATADGPTRTLATIADPEGNPIGLAGHA